METGYPYITCMKNDWTLLGYEYFAPGNGVIIGFHDPRKAKRFQTKKEAEDFLKLFDMSEAKIENVEKHIQKFDQCDYKYREIPMLDTGLDIPYNFHTPDEVIEWWKKIQTVPDKTVSSKNYGTWPKLWSITNHLWDVAKYNSRDYKEMYHTVQVYTQKEGNFESFKKDIDKVIDFCTFVDEEGYKVLPIFDKDLSKHGTRYFLYKSPDDCRVSEGRFGSPFKGNMEKCFSYMHTRFWYE
jgi:hypothetical protein